MRARTNKTELAIFVVTLIATSLLASAAPLSAVHPDIGSNRLVSIQQLPDMGMCSSDPVHKEVIIATAAGNTIVTYCVPEVFD